ncbi:helix-turn-helix domain-containing protein [Cetobacterium somerae]|uniref:helix-turn-helix domain-containing protein n=1 Tax=Cetobacterium somerae TaxID=188913 RepID=UPI003D769D29
MDVFLKDNDLKILRYILYNNNSTIKKISEFVNLSDVYVRESIKKINKYLKLNFDFEIVKIGKELHFPIEKKELFSQQFPKNISGGFSSKKIRVDYIILTLIFQNKIKLTEIAEFFNVTRLTISNDLKEVKSILKSFNLNLESKKWEGISLSTESDRFSFFSIEYLTKILFEQGLTLNITTQYSITNSHFSKYLNSFINLETQKSILNFLQNLVKDLNLNLDIFNFQSFYAAIIFSYIHKEFNLSKVFFIKRKYLKESSDKHIDYFKNIPGYDSIKHINLELLSILIVGNTIDALDTPKFFPHSIFEFIIKLEGFFKFNFLYNDKLVIKNMLKTYLFKKKYELTRFTVPIKNIPSDNLIFISKMNSLINKDKEYIYYDDIVELSFFLKSLKKKYFCEKGKNKSILLVDSEYNLWLSENLKDFISLNYCIGQIDLLSIFNNINWNSLEKKYDAIFFINLKKPIDVISFNNCFEISYFGNNQFFLEEYINFGG